MIILLILIVSVFGEFLNENFLKCGKECQGRGPWKGYGSLLESNVKCTNDGKIHLFIDDKESIDVDGSTVDNTGGGIVYQLQGNDVKGSYHVTVSLPEEQPEGPPPPNGHGTGVAFVVFLVPVGYPGDFTRPGGDLADECANYPTVRINGGFCPGSVLLSFDSCIGSEAISGDLENAPFGQTVTWGFEISDTEVKVIADGKVMYTKTGSIPSGAASNYQLFMASRPAYCTYGQFDWLGVNYDTYIEDVSINGQSVTLCGESQGSDNDDDDESNLNGGSGVLNISSSLFFVVVLAILKVLFFS